MDRLNSISQRNYTGTQQGQPVGRGPSASSAGRWFRPANNFIKGLLQRSSLVPPSNNLSVSQNSITHQIPVEIWERILWEAARSPLLPFTSEGELFDSFIMSYDLFTPACKASREYRDTTLVIIKRLRLVCRSWAQILQSHMHLYAVTDLTKYHIPSEKSVHIAKRLLMTNHHTCQYSRRDKVSCPLSLFDKKGHFTEYWALHSSLLAQSLPSARILSIGDIGFASLPSLQSLPNIRSLSMSSRNISEPWSLKRVSAAIPQLTHLQIRNMDTDNSIAIEDVLFPNVRTLDVSLEIYNSPSKNPYAQWSFPRLQTLHVQGNIHAPVRDAMFEFASRHGDTLVELIYTVLSRQVKLPPASLWESCPNIKAFGMDLEPMFYRTSVNGIPQWEARPAEFPPLVLFIYDFAIGWERPAIATGRIKVLKEKLNIERIVSVYSWEHIQRKRLSSLKAAPKGAQRENLGRNREIFLEMLLELNIPIYDRFGASLQSALKTHYL
ncbi:hypothetical protein CPB86DRAFT_283247 [Serendipita vermifera]|nr:hypothetical protein CPB86DRAFT_283247 [Serendipita vermifera]